jgi:hypothetical protein
MAVSRTAQRALVVERLCPHHNVARFASGEAIYDNMLRVAVAAIATATENDAFSLRITVTALRSGSWPSAK